MSDITKLCACCKELVDRTEFQKKKQSKDGLHNYCKPCSSLKRTTRYALKEKEQAAQYYKDNIDHIKDRKSKFYQENREVIIKKVRDYEVANYNPQKKKEYYESNCEIKKSNMKEYAKSNLPKFRAYNAKRKAAKLQRTPAWADLDAIAEFYQNCPEGYEVDHIIPLQGKVVSGFHVVENLQYLTKTENIRKGNRYVG
jgi:hypothetical protein